MRPESYSAWESCHSRALIQPAAAREKLPVFESRYGVRRSQAFRPDGVAQPCTTVSATVAA
jgi:hypothetical protein